MSKNNKNIEILNIPLSELKPFEDNPFKVRLDESITEVQNGKNYMEAVKEAYEIIYKSVDASFNYDEQFSLDTCYRDIPTVGMEKLTVARKLLLEAQK